MQVQVQIGDTRKVLFIPQPNSYAELHDAIKKEIHKARSVNFSLPFKNDEIRTQSYKNILFVNTTFYNAATITKIQKRTIVLRSHTYTNINV